MVPQLKSLVHDGLNTQSLVGGGGVFLSRRGVSTASVVSSGVTPPSSSAALSQPIVISDTPSPAVSIITIHSDTDTEDEHKFHPAR